MSKQCSSERAGFSRRVVRKSISIAAGMQCERVAGFCI